jgi:hypothetical protein
LRKNLTSNKRSFQNYGCKELSLNKQNAKILGGQPHPQTGMEFLTRGAQLPELLTSGAEPPSSPLLQTPIKSGR